MNSAPAEQELPRPDRTLTEQTTLDQFLENISRISPPMLSRLKVEEITGGVIKAKTLANIDSCPEADSIQPRIRMGGKVCYSKETFIAFLKRRCETF